MLACQDRSIRVLKDSSVLHKMEVPGPPTCLSLFYNDGGDQVSQPSCPKFIGCVVLIKVVSVQATLNFWHLARLKIAITDNW